MCGGSCYNESSLSRPIKISESRPAERLLAAETKQLLEGRHNENWWRAAARLHGATALLTHSSITERQPGARVANKKRLVIKSVYKYLLSFWKTKSSLSVCAGHWNQDVKPTQFMSGWGWAGSDDTYGKLIKKKTKKKHIEHCEAHSLSLLTFFLQKEKTQKGLVKTEKWSDTTVTAWNMYQ